MSALPFDTHSFYTELVESGLAAQTAEALTKAVTKIEMAKLEELATKRDLKELDSTFKRDLKELDAALQLKIEQTKSDLQRWTVTVVLGTAILQTSIIAALILKLAGGL